MNDLRHDPDASKPKPTQAFANIRAQFGAQFDAIDPDAADRRDPTWYAASDTATVRVVAAGDLRTVPMPNLRSPDCRTSDDKTRAELVRIVDALQALTLRVEELERGRG